MKQLLEALTRLTPATALPIDESQKTYVTGSKSGWHVLNSNGEVAKTFPATNEGRGKAQQYVKLYYESLQKESIGESKVIIKKKESDTVNDSDDKDHSSEAAAAHSELESLASKKREGKAVKKNEEVELDESESYEASAKRADDCSKAAHDMRNSGDIEGTKDMQYHAYLAHNRASKLAPNKKLMKQHINTANKHMEDINESVELDEAFLGLKHGDEVKHSGLPLNGKYIGPTKGKPGFHDVEAPGHISKEGKQFKGFVSNWHGDFIVPQKKNESVELDESNSKWTHKDATANTTHLVVNKTTGKAITPHRDKMDARDGMVAAMRQEPTHSYSIVKYEHPMPEKKEEPKHVIHHIVKGRIKEDKEVAKDKPMMVKDKKTGKMYDASVGAFKDKISKTPSIISLLKRLKDR